MSPVTLLHEDHIVQVMMPLSLGRCVCVTSRYLMEHGVAFQRRTHELEETDTNNCVVSIGMVWHCWYCWIIGQSRSIYKSYRRGPRINPCGTPYGILTRSHLKSPTRDQKLSIGVVGRNSVKNSVSEFNTVLKAVKQNSMVDRTKSGMANVDQHLEV